MNVLAKMMSANDRRGPSASLLRLRKVSAQFVEQSLELRFFCRLSGVIRGPVLCVGLARDLNRLGGDRRTVYGLLAFDCVFNGEDVFASVAREFVISASATWLFRVQRNGVFLQLVAL